MSSGGSIIGLEIRVAAMLIRSIIDLGIKYRAVSSMRTTDGQIYNVDMVATDENGRDIGFQKTEKGDYRIIADCKGLNKTQLKKQQDTIKQIRQRYSYNVVVDNLKKQGYVIAEEEKVHNNTIRLVARKWS